MSYKDSMATNPEAMLKRTTDLVKNITPDELEKINDKETDVFVHPMQLEHTEKAILFEKDENPYKEIDVKRTREHVNEIVKPALLSKEEGEILWGRIQGTKYEAMALDYIENQLNQMGLDHVVRNHYESPLPLWRPTVNELAVTQAYNLAKGEEYSFKEALTPFHSACTDKNGIEREVIFVGEGSDAELKGRDLTGKIALLKARTLPGGAMYGTCRVAFSRLASGKYGKPDGVIIWWDLPGAKQIAGRVGAPGGGDEIGLALPWISIGNEDGYYLRYLIDESTDESPVTIRMNVQGCIEQGKDRMTGNVIGVLEGCEDKYILLVSHVDGYFYGLLDNGVGLSMNMTLAEYYAKLPKEKRRYGMIFFYTGGHEVPGVGTTIQFAAQYKKELKEKLMLVIRIEKQGGALILEEGPINLKTNCERPYFVTLTHRTPLMEKIIDETAYNYQVSTTTACISDPASDEMGFYPPFNDLGDIISFGWATSGPYYHSTIEAKPGFILDSVIQRMLWAHAYLIGKIFEHTPAELYEDGIKRQDASIFTSDLFSRYLGQY